MKLWTTRECCLRTQYTSWVPTWPVRRCGRCTRDDFYFVFPHSCYIFPIHCGASTQSWCFVQHFWNVPQAVGLIVELLCSPIGQLSRECDSKLLSMGIRGRGFVLDCLIRNQNFWKKTKQNIVTEWRPHSVELPATAILPYTQQNEGPQIWIATKDLAEWADGSKQGLIVFSLGLTMNLQLNLKMFSSLMGAFSKLRQRVIFKALVDKEALSSVEVPKNVILRRSIPLRY